MTLVFPVAAELPVCSGMKSPDICLVVRITRVRWHQLRNVHSAACDAPRRRPFNVGNVLARSCVNFDKTIALGS